MFSQKISIIKKIEFNFLRLSFSCYYCSIDLTRRSEHSGLRPETSSFVLILDCNSNISYSSHNYFNFSVGQGKRFKVPQMN